MQAGLGDALVSRLSDMDELIGVRQQCVHNEWQHEFLRREERNAALCSIGGSPK
jgi:hypothetical protein